MKKLSPGHRMWLNFKVNMQTKVLNGKKLLRHLYDNSKPYLRGRYWVIYVICFGLGIYLFGPAHGYQKLSTFKIRTSRHSDRDSIEALKQELELLKSDFRKIEAASAPKKLEFNPGEFDRPGPGKVITPFNWVNSGGSWKLHSGVDIAAEPGSNIVAAGPGTVTMVTLVNNGTYTVRIDHGDGWESAYSGLSQVNVTKGTAVIRGVVIGKSGYSVCGSENPGFHFAIYHDGQAVDPQKIVQGLMP